MTRTTVSGKETVKKKGSASSEGGHMIKKRHRVEGLGLEYEQGDQDDSFGRQGAPPRHRD